MVILQFNKLIRNKWVWGVFAVVISAAFCFDDLFTTREREERNAGEAGLLAGTPVKAADFQAVAEDMRGIGQGRDWKRPASEVNRQAWETLAAVLVAERNGIVATDQDVQAAIRADRSFQQNGAFSFSMYNMLLRQNGILPERFEQFLKRRLTLARVTDTMLEAAAWISPVELDRAVADMTDSLTVRVATFKQTKESADRVKLDEAGLRKWYDENTNSLALPERVKIRMLRFSATDEKLLAKMTVTDDELHDYYDANSEKYTVKGTNDTETVKKFEEVKDEIDKELRKIAAIQSLETNLSFRAYVVKAAEGSSRLDEIAKEDGLKVAVSGWFALEGGYVDGFMKHASSICPGAENFNDVVAQLDPTSEDLRYGVVTGKDAVWLVERAELSKAHVPAFDEAKTIIRPRAERAAKEEAFKAEVNAIAAKGTNAVLSVAGVSTNLTFSVAEIGSANFPNQYQVARAASKLSPGGISEFTRTGPDSALLVVCIERRDGDAAKATIMKSQMREQLGMLQRRELPEQWQKWNLERLGFEPSDIASVTPEAASEED